jgi:hypothetical protein
MTQWIPHPDMTGWSDRDVIRYGVTRDLRMAGCTCTPEIRFADTQDYGCTLYITHAADCEYE